MPDDDKPSGSQIGVFIPSPAPAITRTDQNAAAVYLARLAPRSRIVQLQALRAIAELLAPGVDVAALPWFELRYQHTQAARAALAASGRAPATVNRILAALRGTLREAWRLGQLSAEDFHRAADLEPVRGFRLPAGRELAAAELDALFAAANPRDAALLGLCYGAGLRRSEAAAVDVADLVDGVVRVRAGKGNKAREVPIAGRSRAAVESWAAGRAPGPMLEAARGGAALTGQGVLAALRRLGARAGVKAFSPHDLRRTFVSRLLAAGVDISTVAKLAGHSRIDTTARYDRRGEDAKRRAAELLDGPPPPPRAR